MKSNLNLFTLIMFIITVIISTSVFYFFEEDIQYSKNISRTSLTETEAIVKIKDYNPQKSYFFKEETTYKKTKTSIPFYYKKEVISNKKLGTFSE